MIMTVSLQPYPRPHMLSLMDFLEGFLPAFEDHVDVVFGWAWAMDFHNWAERTMPMAMVRNEVRSAEDQNFGRLVDDDLYVRVKSHGLEIHFCHEGDIHVGFSRMTPVVEGVLEHLIHSYPTIALEKQGHVSRVFAFGLPVFLCGVTLINETEAVKEVNLLPWNRKVQLEPQEKLGVTGYAQKPGLLKIEQYGGGYVATGWVGCDVRVTRNSETVFDSASDS